jgi:hypothetical protein
MIPTSPLLKSSPCDQCRASVEDGEDCWCEKYRDACNLAEYASKTATLIHESRLNLGGVYKDLASDAADSIDNAMQDVGASLDIPAFLLACGWEVKP